MRLHDWGKTMETSDGLVFCKCHVCGQTTLGCSALCPGKPVKTPLIKMVEEYRFGGEEK